MTPVTGDITTVWKHRLKHADSNTPMILRGVTTESFHFCLKILLQSRTKIDTEITRVDRDLYLWTIHTNNNLLTG